MQTPFYGALYISDDFGFLCYYLRHFYTIENRITVLVSDFHFNLPDELIARYPTAERSASRLLHLNGETGEFADQQFVDLYDHINEGDLLIFNNTRVIPARLYGRKPSGGKVEALVERVLDEHRCLAHVKASKAPKEGAELIFGKIS